MDPLNRYAAPLSGPEDDLGARAATAARDGSLLVLGKQAELPKLCVGCGGKKKVKYAEETFDYIPGVVWLLFPVFGIFIAVVFKSIIKRAVVSIPRCGECSLAARRAQEARGPIGIGGVLVLLAAATAAGNGARVLGVVIFVLGAVAFVAATRRWWKRGISATHVDDETVTLRGINEKVLATFAPLRK